MIISNISSSFYIINLQVSDNAVSIGLLKGSIDSLKKAMEDGFASLREEVTRLHEDFKNETEAIKAQLQNDMKLKTTWTL